VPALVSWKGRLKPKKVTSPLHVTDWMPTLCALVGYEPTDDPNWDGRDVWPLLTGAIDHPPPRMLYTQGVHQRAAAIHRGNWKLIVRPHAAAEQCELYDLSEDPSESRDVASAHPEKVAELKELLYAEKAKDNDARPGDDKDNDPIRR